MAAEFIPRVYYLHHSWPAAGCFCDSPLARETDMRHQTLGPAMRVRLSHMQFDRSPRSGSLPSAPVTSTAPRGTTLLQERSRKNTLEAAVYGSVPELQRRKDGGIKRENGAGSEER